MEIFYICRMVKNQRLKRAGLLVIFTFLFLNIFPQFVNDCNYERPHQADVWVFGDKANVDFFVDPPAASPTSGFHSMPNGVAAISDVDGNLIIYTNGIEIWNSSGHKIANGGNLNGNNFASQSSLIVPQPGNSRKFYVFTADMYIPGFFDDGVNYAIVDFSSNGNGAVTSKNNLLFKQNAQKLTGVQHANGTDYWVIAHGFGQSKGDEFYAYLVSDTGLVTTPVTSRLGTKQQGSENNAAGYMKTSPDGSKLALIIPEDGIAELYNFNTATGQVSNLKASAAGQFSYGLGIEFSPDNSKFYISTSPLNADTNYLYQIDANAANPFANPYVVDKFFVQQVGAADSLMGALQLGVDGKIYMAKFEKGIYGKNYLGSVYNPNRPGAACNYNSLNYVSNNGLYLNGGKSLIGLPNFVTTFLDIPHFTYIEQCHHDTTLFTIRNNANIDGTDWNFNDNDGDQVGNDPFNPGFVFSEPGDYTVQLTETFDGVDYSFSEPVRIHPLPYVDLGIGFDTIYILPNTSVQLDAGDWDNYYWQPGGSTGRYYTVTQEGLYSVMVQDSNCCVNGDQVYVEYTNLYYPNAFRPGSSIIENSVFKVVGNTASLGGYLLQVYDRWGQMIFETKDPAQGWDGTYKGDPVQLGTYVWKSVFNGFDVGDQPGAEFKYHGTVTLVR